MAYNVGKPLVDSGLVLCYDAGNPRSYPGSGTSVVNLSGQNYNGALTNGVAFSSDVFIFDGVNDYITLPRPVQDDFTLCCWFKTTQSVQLSTANQWWNGVGLVDCEVAGVVNDFGMSVQLGKVDFGVGNPDVTIQSTSTYSNNLWHYAVGTRTKSTGIISLYVDNVFIGIGTGNTSSLTTASTLRVGSLQNNFGFFQGSIAQVSVYNRALTPSEIQQNFNALRGRFGI